MDCKTIKHLKSLVDTARDPYEGEVAKSTLDTIDSISQSRIQPSSIEMLYWLVDGLVASGNVALLGDIHTEPDCVICSALSLKLRSVEAEKA